MEGSTTRMKQYLQCKMQRKIGNTNSTITTHGWIEARGAKVGSQVELLSDDKSYSGLWTVIEVFEPKISHEVLKENEHQRRQGLPSIRNTEKDKRKALK